MASESNERLDRIEANLDRLTELTVQTAERQSIAEERQSAAEERQRVAGRHIDQILAAVAADGENIRALVRVAEAHQRRIEDLEQGKA
jgi:hypothetical protein